MLKKILTGGLVLGTSAYGYSTYKLHFTPSKHAQECAIGKFIPKDLEKPTIGYCTDEFQNIIEISVPVDAKSTLGNYMVNSETGKFTTDKAFTKGIDRNSSMRYDVGLKNITNGKNYTIGNLVTREDGSPLDKPFEFFLTPITANSYSEFPDRGKRTICQNDNSAIEDQVYTIDYGNTVTRYYDNGVVCTETEYNKISYKKNGIYRSYWPDGTLERTGRYKNDERTGMWISRDETGKDFIISLMH